MLCKISRNNGGPCLKICRDNQLRESNFQWSFKNETKNRITTLACCQIFPHPLNNLQFLKDLGCYLWIFGVPNGRLQGLVSIWAFSQHRNFIWEEKKQKRRNYMKTLQRTYFSKKESHGTWQEAASPSSTQPTQPLFLRYCQGTRALVLISSSSELTAHVLLLASY